MQNETSVSGASHRRGWLADPMHRAVHALGITQITAWGVSYYCLGVLANPIVTLAPAFARRSRRGGRLVLSGILYAQADAVIAAYARWFNIRVCESEEGWVALEGARTGSSA